jgi:hypothetical protein
MDMNARKKKAVELLASRRGTRPPAGPMPGSDEATPSTAPPPMASRFADVIARRKAMKK